MVNGPYSIWVHRGGRRQEVTDPEAREEKQSEATSVAAYISLAMDALDIDGAVTVEDGSGLVVWKVETGKGGWTKSERIAARAFGVPGGVQRVRSHVRRR